MSAAVSNAAAPANKKRTYDELGNHDGDDDESDKDTSSGLAAFFHYAKANHEQARAALSSENAKATFGKVAKELANNYRALSAAEISKWQEIAITSNVDFVEEMKPYSEPTKTRKKKNPEAPKRPISAFFHYMMAVRTKTAAEEPDMSFGEVTRECAARFKALTDKNRKEWDDKAVADKARYKVQQEAFEKEEEAKNKTQEKVGDDNEDDHDEETSKPKKKAKKTPAQEPNKEKAQENAKAKKAPTQEHGEEKTHENVGNQKEDDPKDEDKLKKKNKRNKRKTLTEEEDPTEKTQEKKEHKKKEKRSADAPRWYKPGYTLYMEENRETIQKANPGMVHSEISKLGSANFKALPEKEHQKWMDQAVADKARFDQEMEVYNIKQGEGKKDEGGDECDV
jgi:high mobility group protein B2